MPNLGLLPSYIDFANYSTFLDLKFRLVDSKNPSFSSIVNKKIKYLSSLVKPLKEKFDFIFLMFHQLNPTLLILPLCERLCVNCLANTGVKPRWCYSIFARSSIIS